MYSFSDIFGNKQLIENLKKSLQNSTLSHAYLFLGPSGIGKTLLSYTFAKSILCEEEYPPCGICSSCRVFDNYNNPDFIKISTYSKTIGVEIIRDVIKDIIIPPNGNKKILLIDNVDIMTVAAQNSLLKTLEEPPKYLIIMLLGISKNNLLVTLLSRCTIINMLPLPDEDVMLYAKKNNIHENRFYINYAAGNIGTLIKISSDEDFKNLRNFTIDFLLNLENASLDSVFDLFKNLEERRDKINEILSIMQIFFRDCLILISSNFKNDAHDYIIQYDNINIISSYARNLTIEQIIKRNDAINFTIDVLSKNANFQMAIEVMLIRIRQS
ncbi:MAG: AAA family ATPase [Defluviitaleaceae bacterium]|nr:AAA family ATPase [Defluviitaleaceae bacterium]